jgi:hypothetical protein
MFFAHWLSGNMYWDEDNQIARTWIGYFDFLMANFDYLDA